MALELMLCKGHIVGLTFDISSIWEGGVLIGVGCLETLRGSLIL